MAMSNVVPGAESASSAMVVSSDSSFRMQLEPSDFEAAYRLASIAASLRLCGVSSPEDALVRIMTGRELGLTAFQGMRLIYVVEGRPGMDASLMLALCLNRPECEYFEMVESSPAKATYRAKRKGRPEVALTWTMEQAVAAGLVSRGKDSSRNNWNRYPDAMLRARCVSALARIVFPEAICGLYTREELTSSVVVPVAGVAANEFVGEVADQAERAAEPARPAVANAPRRDFATEADALKQKIADAKTKEDRRAVRAEVVAFAADAGEPWAKSVKDFYNLMAPAAAPPPPPPVSASALEPPPGAGDAWEAAQ